MSTFKYSLGLLALATLVAPAFPQGGNSYVPDSLKSRIQAAKSTLQLAPVLPPVHIVGMGSAALQSDDFDHCGGLQPLWTVVDPQLDGSAEVTGAGTGQALLEMSAPAGVEHQAWNNLTAQHVVQPLAAGDFEVELKFTDAPGDEEIYGLLIKQDTANWLRFDFYGYGGSVYAYSGRTLNSRTAQRSNNLVSGVAGELWMRVQRSGNSYTFRTSTDGSVWTVQRTFNQVLNTIELGPYLGNFGSKPQASMAVDYVFDSVAPIVPEDASAGQQPLSLSVQGSGTVDANPPGGLYGCGVQVTVTATPDSGWAFDRWQGDLSGTAPVATVTMNGPLSVVAIFEELSGAPPVISGVQLDAGSTAATVSWQTDVPADSQVDYGLTQALGSTAYYGSFVNQHVVPLYMLNPGSTYYIQVSSATPTGVRSQAGSLVLVTQPQGPVIVSDDFNECGGPSILWSAEDPTAAVDFLTTGMGSQDALLEISSPPGLSVNPFGTLSIPYLWQPMGDGDFDIASKLHDLPGADGSAGLLFIEDTDNWFSFELYRSQGVVNATAVLTTAGVSLRVIDTPTTVSGETWMGVTRTGDTWDLMLSGDGANYTSVGTQIAALDQNRFGVYGGNLGSLPALDTRFDYVEDAQLQLVPEDGPIGGVAPRIFTLDPSISGGTVNVSPLLTGYSCDELLTLTAQPDAGFTFAGWTGDLSGTANPISLMMLVDRNVGALFAPVSNPPVISNIQAAPNSTGANITWQTDVPSSSRVDYGLTNAYGSFEESTVLVTNHQMLLSGLTESTSYHFQVSSDSGGGQVAQGPDTVFTTDPVSSIPFLSDDFHGCGGLASQWAFVDSSFGDGAFRVVGAGTGDAQLTISVPAGVERQNYNTLGSPRVMQACQNVDFEVELRFESEVETAYQIQGVLIQEDASNWLRFDVYRAPNGIRYFAGSTVNGSTNQVGDGSLALSAPYYMRVQRVGNQWTYSLSGDGANYQQMATFTRPMVVSELGPYAANAFRVGVSPAFTAEVDYVFESTTPIVPEDGSTGGTGPYTLNTTVPGGGGSVQLTPQQNDYLCGEQVTLTPQPDVGFVFVDWGGDASGNQNPLVWTVTANANIEANFIMNSGAPVISNVQVVATMTDATVTWDTVDPADSTVDYGLTNALGSSASNGAFVTQHSVLLTGLDPTTTYFYQVTSQDTVGNSSSEPIASFSTLGMVSLTSADFHEPNLDRSVWTFTDPAGVAQLRLVGSGTSNARMEIEIPGGTAYEPFLTNGAARLSQEIVDEDFTFAVKFENPITSVNTSTGVFVEQDVDDWIRLDYYFDGTNLNVFSGRFANGNFIDFEQLTVQSGPWVDESPLYLRVVRVANLWTTQYSLDGVGWITVDSFGFALAPQRVGVLCGNSAGAREAQTIAVDWFESEDMPIVNEDPAAGVDTVAPYIYDIDAVALSENAVQISWATDEVSSGHVQWGLTSSYGQVPVSSSASGYQHSVTLLGLSSNTQYHFQIDSADLANNTASSSDQTVTTLSGPGTGAPQIDFWHGTFDTLLGAQVFDFGILGNAQPQFNVMGRVLDADQNRIALEVSLEYRLNNGVWNTLALGDDRTISYAPWRLANEGDFNIELFITDLLGGPLMNGVHSNTLELRATDDMNNQTLVTAMVNYTPGVTWNGAVNIDWTAAFNNGQAVEDLVQIVDGKWEIHNHPTLGPVLRPDPNELGYDRLVAIGEGDGVDGWHNYEALFPATVHALDPQGYTTGTSSYAMGFLLRWTGHTPGGNYAQPSHGLYPLGGLWIYRWFNAVSRWQLWINENGTILNQSGNDISLGVTYWYRVRCEDAAGGGTLYAFKVWPDGQTEPSGWTFQHTTNPGDPQRGSLLLVSHHVDVSFGNITVTQLP